MSTLYNNMLILARKSGKTFFSGVATGGTTTTIIDTVYRVEEDDTFNGQTVFMLDGDDANKTRKITDFAETSHTITVGTAFSAAISAGDRYLISQAQREDLVQAINAALSDIGEITNVDTSLTVVDNQTEYTLPAGVSNVVRVEVANSSSADYDYTVINNWREINGYLYFTTELGFSAGNTIRVYYNAQHDAVDADTDTISDSIPMPLIGAISAYYYALQQYANQGNSNDKDEFMLNQMQSMMFDARQRFRVRKIHRDAILGRE